LNFEETPVVMDDLTSRTRIICCWHQLLRNNCSTFVSFLHSWLWDHSKLHHVHVRVSHSVGVSDCLAFLACCIPDVIWGSLYLPAYMKLLFYAFAIQILLYLANIQWQFSAIFWKSYTRWEILRGFYMYFYSLCHVCPGPRTAHWHVPIDYLPSSLVDIIIKIMQKNFNPDSS
jgi:hypothetical protein